EENKLGPGLHLIKLYVEGDGTLTINDWENIRSYLDEFVNGAYNPKIYEGAKEFIPALKYASISVIAFPYA
ncbi:hypothetical protein ACT4UT_29385, partial [Bacillus sp. B-TM1]